MHSDTRRQELREIAKAGIAELYHHPQRERFPEKFKFSVRNEYYWFFELHENQFALGEERIARGDLGGSYSKCVGAASQASKLLLNNRDLPQAIEWAQRSIDAFRDYEKFNPHWYNINYFAADALAIMGLFDEARAVFRDMYRKQGNPVNELEWQNFEEKLHKIAEARAAMLTR